MRRDRYAFLEVKVSDLADTSAGTAGANGEPEERDCGSRHHLTD